MEGFPSLANFLVCCLVTISGGYWLRVFSQKYGDEHRYIFRSYLCWWLSWAVWVVVWGIIAFTELKGYDRRLVLGLSDLNAIFLITLYFNLTRGNTYKPTSAFIDFGYLVLVLAAGYLIFLFVLSERFDNLQEGWGLCLSAVSTLLVGWSFLFRYKTRLILIAGFVYAFSQPFVFDVVLQKDTNPLTGAIEFVSAILKILWATAVTAYFTQLPTTAENIVVDSGKGALIPPLKKLPMPFLIQTVVLLLAGIILTFIISIHRFPEIARGYILPIFGGLAALATFAASLGAIFSRLKRNLSKEDKEV